ncbi:MAG: C25 family cysteine peptidase, partial [Lentimicrobiaceae bacterium]|nr:C25 family cysteine peptidase [Lentimicrobiaceae bacterium]
MKKIFSLFFVFVGVLTTGIFAQNQVLTVGNNGNNMNQTVLMLSNETQTTIRFDLNAVELFEIETGYGNAFILTSDNAPLMLEEGSPELFYLTTSFIIPDQGGSELEISYGSYQDFENIDIAPSKGSLSRNIDPNTVPYVKGDVYQRDGFFPGTLENLREPFIMRDVRGQSIDVYPVQYNPVTKTLRVYSEITVTVNKTKETGINEFTTQKRNKTIDPTFNDMYSRLFINSSTLNSRGYPTGEEGELLIICHSDWVNDMQPYINWKRTIGRKTTIVPTSAISPLTAANIKTYIQNFYNNPDNNLAFVLFVGDYQQLPPHQVGSTRSDVEYCKLAGSDDYLEILTGRMSCETPAHVQTQVQRAIEYERDLITDDTWITSAIGVADVQGSGIGHDGGEADYVHLNNIRTRLLNYGYTTVYQEYSGVGSGTTNAQISADFNAGVSMGNYCNHGSPTCWTLNSGPNYCSSDVNALQNARKLPYIFSVACNNGEFGPWQYNSSNAVCFAEAWLRASQSGQPTGAIAFFGATISISWQEPQTAQDEFVNICLDLPSPYSGTQPGIKRTIAGAMLNASQKMIMVHNNSDAKACFNSWIVFGDPTLNFRTKTPQEMAISHQSALLIGMNSLSVTCDAEGAVAALTCIENDEVVILGTATVTNGTAEINFDSSTLAPMDLILTVTGFNKVTYMSEISLIPPSGPYVVPGGYTVVGDEVLTYISENKEISITLKNVGVAATTPLSVTISCDDSQLTITSNTATCGSIAPDGTATVNFNVTVANDIIDGKIFPVNVTVTETSKTSWDGKLMLKAFAPSFELEKVLINGAANGSLPKGTIVTLTTVIKNKGGADAFNLKGSLEMNSPYVILACDEDKSRAAINLVAGESTSFDFVVITSPDMPFGHIANFDLLVNANYGITHEETFTVSNSGSNNYCIPGSSNCSSYNDRITSIQILKTSDQEVLLNDPTPSCTAG